MGVVSRKRNGPRQEEPVASLVERSIWNGRNELLTCGKVRQVVFRSVGRKYFLEL